MREGGREVSREGGREGGREAREGCSYMELSPYWKHFSSFVSDPCPVVHHFAIYFKCNKKVQQGTKMQMKGYISNC